MQADPPPLPLRLEASTLRLAPSPSMRRRRRLASVLQHICAASDTSPVTAAAGAPPPEAERRPCVCIAYAELASAMGAVSAPLQKLIAEAYGYDGLGILAVTGVPDLAAARQALLPLAAQFAALPEGAKQRTETPHAHYQVGWSYGNEKLQGDRPDWAKGSYYANPLVDVPSTDAELISRFPAFLEPNIWPSEDLPGFEDAFKTLGRAVVDVGQLVAKQCDDFVDTPSKLSIDPKLTVAIQG
jgi:hypothetical protein